jgi:hypothetical protein
MCPIDINEQWSDEQLANTVSEVYLELQDVEFREVAEAARQCRKCVPRSAGLPALRHQMRRRALGLAVTEFTSPALTRMALR